MQITFVTGLALTLAWALATVLPPISAAHRSLHRRTLDPAESNSKGMKPVDIDWYVSLSLSLIMKLFFLLSSAIGQYGCTDLIIF